MKRGGPIRRKTPLRNRRPIRRGRRIRGTSIRERPVGKKTLLDWTLCQELRDRAKGRCERCSIPDHVRPCQAHHRQLKSQGGRDVIENLLYLCWVCHDWVHGNPKAATRAGWIIQQNPDPLP